MAACTQSDMVFSRIISEMASLLDMMNPKFRPTSAILESPTITMEHLLTQFPVGFWVERNARTFLAKPVHDGFCNCSRNFRFGGEGAG